MKKKLIIIGAGGFAKSVLESINATEFQVAGFVDSYKTGKHQDISIIANSLDELKNKQKYVYFVAIGDPETRSAWFEEVNKHNLEQINVIDSTSIISPSAELGTGIYVGKMCIINSDSTLSDGVVVNTRSLIEHGNKIGYCSNVSTNVVLNGDVIVGDTTFVGSCTVVNGQISIGSKSIIGSGSVVIKHIPDKVVVAGSPTRLIKEIE